MVTLDEEPGAAQLGGHIRQLEGDALLGRDGLAELDALLGIWIEINQDILKTVNCSGKK